jgi:hypothetical protein
MKDEEVALKIVRLYFQEVARLGFKRQLDLDQMINSYFYALKKLKNKEATMKKMTEQIVKEEKTITSDIEPSLKETTTTTTITSESK